jgi:membrane protein YqaA with SNARE-associated domain
MDFLFTAEAGLTGLFLASFLAATLLPGGSEAVLLAVLLAHPEQALPAWVLATVGNTLGGMTTYGMGRWLPDTDAVRTVARVGAGKTAVRSQKMLAALKQHGAPLLVLAWVPFIGDLLCAAAGWLRLPWLASALWMLLGKGARYAALIAGIGAI